MTKPMTFAVWAVLASAACQAASAQSIQFLPELDTNLALNRSIRMVLQAKDDTEGGDSQQFTYGPSFQFSLKPLLRLKKVTLFDLDDAKQRMLVLESGYRIITSPGTPVTNRAIEAVTFHAPTIGAILLSDRNRVDLDWQAGSFDWRYRNKLMAERTISTASYHVIPYVAVEPFYESKYGKWSTTDLYAGCRFPAGKVAQFDLYYEHENNTGKSPNRQNNYIGLSLTLFFSSRPQAP